MQADELLAQNAVHLFDGGSMRPVGIMDSCKCDSFSIALLGSIHHVGRIKAMHKIRWESTLLPAAIDGHL